MPDFHWNSSYLVGHPEMDAQHMEMAALINELFSYQEAQRPEDNVVDVLNRLIAHTIRHFSYENRLMLDSSYPLYADHMQEHELLTQQIVNFRDELEAGTRELSSASMLFLKQWLLNHVLNTDRKVAEFILHPVR